MTFDSAIPSYHVISITRFNISYTNWYDLGIGLFEDSYTRKIMEILHKGGPIHVHGLMDALDCSQNALYARIKNLKEERLIGEKAKGNKRQFFLTVKGAKAIYLDVLDRGRNSLEAIQELMQGREKFVPLEFWTAQQQRLRRSQRELNEARQTLDLLINAVPGVKQMLKVKAEVEAQSRSII